MQIMKSDITVICLQNRQIRHNEAVAEYIVDITTQADRAGRADHFGDLYDASQLKAANMADLGDPAAEPKGPALQRTVTVRAWHLLTRCLPRRRRLLSLTQRQARLQTTGVK